MTEQEFHKARRMFIVCDGTVLVAPPGDSRTHFEWLATLFGSDEAHAWIKNHTRGYVLDNRLVAYVGDNFSHWVNHGSVLAAFDLFSHLFGTTVITEIGLGAEPGIGQPWPSFSTHEAVGYRSSVMAKLRRDNAKKIEETAGLPLENPGQGNGTGG